MIITDLQPFSIVEDEGFINFVSGLDPAYKLPNRKTLSKYLLPNEYLDAVNKINKILSGVNKICLTTDTWTSSSTQNYMSLTAHFIDTNWEIKSILIDCILVSVSHTAVNLRDEILKLCSK